MDCQALQCEYKIRIQIIYTGTAFNHQKEDYGVEYKEQLRNLCIQTYFNLYGVMPTPSELDEMLGDEDVPLQIA